MINTQEEFTKTEIGRFEKIAAAVAAIQIPGVTLLADLFGGIRLYIEYHDVIGERWGGQEYVVKHGYRDDVCLGGVDTPMARLRQNLRDEIKAIQLRNNLRRAIAAIKAN